MPFIFQYLIRLSLCYAVMYLFYLLVLRRLTFYNYSRWYLLGYSLLCFFIPLMNIASVPDNSNSVIAMTIQYVPAVTFERPVMAAAPVSHPRINIWYIVGLLLIAGMVAMLVRLVIQIISYRTITRDAILISDEHIKLFQVDKPIVPFSYGNSIYINQSQHTQQELSEILRHEFVHVQQKHTMDILIGELLCIVNWYNPFVWFIRHAIRQNLEFIADDKVVQSGIDKKQYQYILLNVALGNNKFSFTNNFNISSLKKRIVMMNKLKSAKIHLLKLLFLLPVLAVVLVSFREMMDSKKTPKDIFISGIVVDAITSEPLKNVSIEDSVHRISAITNSKGYYSLKVDVKDTATVCNLNFSIKKNGYSTTNVFTSIDILRFSYMYSNQNIGLVKNGESKRSFVDGRRSDSFFTYEKSLDALNSHISNVKIVGELSRQEKLVTQRAGKTYIITQSGSLSLDSPNPVIYMDDRLMSIDKINAAYSQEDIQTYRSIGDTIYIVSKKEKSRVSKVILPPAKLKCPSY